MRPSLVLNTENAHHRDHPSITTHSVRGQSGDRRGTGWRQVGEKLKTGWGWGGGKAGDRWGKR